MLNPLLAKDRKFLQKNSKIKQNDKAEYLDLRSVKLSPFPKIDLSAMERLAKIIRGLIFAMVENSQSGHPGGSSSKVEQFLALTLGGSLAFDPLDPKHPGRDRFVWSAGHCTPLLFSGQALYYEALRRAGRQFSEAVVNCVLPEHLSLFRRPQGPSGHAESQYPFSDYCTGPSGHGFSAAAGLAVSHRASGLNTKIWVLMGDAESEEGMTFEARNVLAASGVDNIVVSLDYNHFGIDGPVEEVMAAPYLNYWLGLGWNVIEVDGHDLNQLLYAYALAKKGFGNSRPVAVVAHTLKGKDYDGLEDTAESHGSPAKHEQYVKAVRSLGFQIKGEEKHAVQDMEKVLETLSEVDCQFVEKRMIESAKLIQPEAEALARMKTKLKNRPLLDPRSIETPKTLPPELIFKSGEKVALRQAASAWFTWLMKQTAFFYAGAGDLAKSVLTNSAENVHGIVSPKNPLGRGLRFGIAEANMGMMSMALTQDVLPGGFRPVSVFGTYGVFAPLYGEQMHLALINNHLVPERAGFFIALAGHDGPETGEDGPTHQGMYWSALFKAYPGIKVFKPFDANEVIEILFKALQKGEPIVLTLPRGKATVMARKNSNWEKQVFDGAYILKDYDNSGKEKICLAISGAVVAENLSLALPEISKKIDLKIVAVTCPEKFAELTEEDPVYAEKIISKEERKNITTLHNGWKGFLDPCRFGKKELIKRMGVDNFLHSAKAEQVVAEAGLDPDSLVNKILSLQSK